MPTYALTISSLIELDANSNPATDTITVQADSLDAAKLQAPPGWVVVSAGQVVFDETLPTESMPTVHKIAGRIQVDLNPADFDDPMSYNMTCMEYILEYARAYLDEGSTTVWVEVQYRDRMGNWDNWDETGDALEIDFSGEEPEVRTLTSEEWQEASK